MASRTKSGTYDRTLGEGGFPGVDFSGMPGSVGPSHFADACNVWRDYDNGQGVCVETIPGFRALMRARGGPDPDHLTDLAVHGVYEYRLARHPYYSEGAGNYLLVHAGHYLWLVPEAVFSGLREDDPPVELTACDEESYNLNGSIFRPDIPFTVYNSMKCVPDAPMRAIAFGDSMYLLGGGCYLAVSPTRSFGLEGGYLMFYAHRVEDYAPLAYVDGAAYEAVNLYSGSEAAEEYRAWELYHVENPAIYAESDGSGYTFPVHLPSTAVLQLLLDEQTFALYDIISDHSEEVNSIVAIRLRITDESEITGKTLRFCLRLKTDFVAQSISPDYTGTARAALTGCTVLCAWDDRIFLTGNPALPGFVFFTSRNADGRMLPGYISALSFVRCGEGGSPNTALLPVPDGLCVCKGDSAPDADAYLLTGIDTGEDLIPRTYTVQRAGLGLGRCHAAVLFDGEPLVLTDRGVFAVLRDEWGGLHLYPRSSRVNGRLAGEGKEHSCMTVFAGYLWVLTDGGRVYLADSRARSSGPGGREFEWFFLSGIGSYTDDAPVYAWLTTHPYEGVYATGKQGYTVRMPDPDPAVPDRAPDDTVTLSVDGQLHSFPAICEGDDCMLLCESGQRQGGTFSPASFFATAADRLFFGTDAGCLCVFNTDLRGTPARAEEQDPAFDRAAFDRACSGRLRVGLYSVMGHPIGSYLETFDDDSDIPHLDKSTVARSTVLDMKSMPGSRFSCRVTTTEGRTAWVGATAATPDFSDLDFSCFSFGTSQRTVLLMHERTRRYLTKRYRLEDGGYCAPFGVRQISYRFTVTGRMKQSCL